MNPLTLLKNGTLFFILLMTFAAPIAYTNCGRASLGNLSSQAQSPNGASSIPTEVGAIACPAGQAPIGLSDARTVVCATTNTGSDLQCPAGSAIYQATEGTITCVPVTSWDQPGALCPVGSYLAAYSSSGAITCIQPRLIVRTVPLNASCPAGQYLSAVVNNQGVCLPLPAGVPSALVCATGQYLNDLNGSVPDCRARPWANAAQSATCAAGTVAVGYAADGTLVCKQNNFTSAGNAANASCPANQVLVSYANGAATCKPAPIADISHACRVGFQATGTASGSLVCQQVTTIGRNPCADGQYVVGLSAGLPVCARVQVNSLSAACATGSYPIGISNGALVCVAFDNTRYPSGTNGCFPGESVSCAVEGGIGTQTCASGGEGYGTCNALSCVAGRELSGGICKPLACQPGTSQSCPVANGTGVQYCDTRGVYGSCQLLTCGMGYAPQNGQCVATSCTPGSTMSCTVSGTATSGAGFGFQTCNSNGVGYGSCFLTSCANGYTLKNGVCVDTTGPRVTFTTQPPVESTLRTARLEYSAADPESGVKATTCSLDAAPYTPCTSPVNLTGLANGAHAFSVTAVDQLNNSTSSTVNWMVKACTTGAVLSCSVTNGSGQQVCNADGSLATCTPTSCSAGFEIKNGICQALSCNPGYSPSGNTCVDNTAPTITIGTAPVDPTIGSTAKTEFAAADLGSGVASLTCSRDGAPFAACASPLTLTNLGYGPHRLTITASDRDGNNRSTTLAWRNFVCAPNQASECSIANGQGRSYCLADGSAQGSCQVTACNNGYVQSGNQCAYIPKACVAPGGGGVAHGQGVTAYESAQVPWKTSCRAETRVCNDGVLSGSYVNKSCSAAPAPAMTPLNRFWDRINGEHFFTAAAYESTMGNRFQSEGVGFHVLQNGGPNTKPVYRCIWPAQPKMQMHFISSDPGCEGYTTEGLYGYIYVSQVPGSTPLYRYFSNRSGDHLSTTNQQEGCFAEPWGYVFENIQGYVPVP